MKYFSMFSGIGGFELGIQQSNCYQPECIGFSEIDKYAVQIYKKHFKHKNYGDATKIDAGKLSDFDLLVGGFPCQAFSIAGKRQGFNETRGTLFFEIARICKEKKPRYILLENVKGLLSHENGATFQKILGVLSDIGYSVEWQILNSKDFGVPQNRERVFIVGHLGGFSRRKVFPIRQGNKYNNEQVQGKGFPKREQKRQYEDGQLKKKRCKNYPCVHRSMQRDDTDKRKRVIKKNRNMNKLIQLVAGSQGNRVYATNGVSTTQAAQAAQAGGQGAKTGLYAITRGRSTENWRRSGIAPSRRASDKDDIKIIYNAKIRRLTPVECERLQGFPDNFSKEGIEGSISDTQRYKCLGNAVTVNVVKSIINNLIHKA